jgi:hypothetical protein
MYTQTLAEINETKIVLIELLADLLVCDLGKMPDILDDIQTAKNTIQEKIEFLNNL